MAELKTHPTAADVDAFLAESARPGDARALAAMMERVSGETATMWGPSIVGFGVHHYRYESGREGAMCRIGFAPRKAEFALYGLLEPDGECSPPDGLGKYRTGKGCLYFKRYADIDPDLLEVLTRDAWQRRG